ncbi:MAG: host-nuclease inhibitor Gam family protein [Alicyclobacillus sp.]|nr:host-nuclease inhibitor Gam family protein [Alicyclobacillus sp.]
MSMTALQVEELRTLDAEEHGTFVVRDLASASWCMRKVQALRAREREINDVADAEVARIEAWRSREQESVQADLAYFEALLREWHAAELARDPRAKTISTPYGTLKARKLPPKVEYDVDKLLQWAREEGRIDLVRVKEEIAAAAVREAVLKDGEALPGVTVVDQGIRFSVEVDE